MNTTILNELKQTQWTWPNTINLDWTQWTWLYSMDLIKLNGLDYNQ